MAEASARGDSISGERGLSAIAGRPSAIRLVAILFSLFASWVLLGLYLRFGGNVPMSAVERAYFQNQSLLEVSVSALGGVLNLAGVVLLVRLRRKATYLFWSALGLNLAMTAWQISQQGWFGTIVSFGAIGTAVRLLLSLAVCLYTRWLLERGALG